MSIYDDSTEDHIRRKVREGLRENLRREMERMSVWLEANKTKKVDGIEIDQTFTQRYQRAVGYLDALIEVEGGRYD